MGAWPLSLAALVLPLLAGGPSDRVEMTLVHFMGEKRAGTERAVVWTDPDSGVRTATTAGELTIMGTSLRLETTLRLKQPGGEVLDYRVEALVGGQPQTNAMRREGRKLAFDVRIGLQEISRELEAEEPVAVLDNMVGIHPVLLLDRLGAVAEEGVSFQAVVPQRLAVVRAMVSRKEPETGRLDGRPIPVQVYEVKLANVLEFVRASPDAPGRLLEVEVPLQGYRIAREGFERGAPPSETAAPPADDAPRAARGSLESEEVTVRSGEISLGGTLTLPARREGKVAGLLLVHGSGPNDRDETIAGVNKPFRDLAEGIGARGVAVLRYDKRTFALRDRAEPAELLSLSATLQDEVIDDAAAAFRLLRRRPEVDPGRVFVLGHSLGGFALPYILMEAEGAAGGISLAGTARPLDEVVLDQMRFLLPRQGVKADEVESRLSELAAAFARVRSGDAGDGEAILGAPARYWRDILSRDPARVAAALPQPLLFLFAAKDYQVTGRELDSWRAACAGAGKGNAVFKTFPGLNHLFMEVEGVSDGSDYQRPGRVAEEVLAEVASWIAEQGP